MSNNLQTKVSEVQTNAEVESDSFESDNVKIKPTALKILSLFAMAATVIGILAGAFFYSLVGEGKVKSVVSDYVNALIDLKDEKAQEYQFENYIPNSENLPIKFENYSDAAVSELQKLTDENEKANFSAMIEKNTGKNPDVSELYLADVILIGKESVNINCRFYVFECGDKWYCVFCDDFENYSYYT